MRGGSVEDVICVLCISRWSNQYSESCGTILCTNINQLAKVHSLIIFPKLIPKNAIPIS